MARTVRAEITTIVRLAIPVAALQLATMGLWFVDLLMVGRVSVEALGTVSLGRLWIMGTLTFGMGVVFGIDPLLTQAHGARDAALLGRTLQRGCVVALIVSVPILVAWASTGPALLALGQDPVLSEAAASYVRTQWLVVPSFLLFKVLRQYLLGRGRTVPPLVVAVVANGINALANWALIFGNLGFPRLEVQGAAIATTVTQIFMLIALAVWIPVARLQRDGWAGWDARALRPEGVWRVLVFGFPVGVQLSLEVWAFVTSNLFAGWIGPVALASHAIVINLASISFMVPLGISIGAVTRVGNLIGEGKRDEAQRAAWIAIGLGFVVMAVFAVVFVVGRNWLPGWYTPDPAVLATSAALLPVAAAFQVFDGVQVVGGGVLRGMGRTRPAAVFNLLGYYALGLPLGAFLAFRAGLGVIGVWWGLAAGLAAVAIALVAWVARRGPAKVDARITQWD